MAFICIIANQHGDDGDQNNEWLYCKVILGKKHHTKQCEERTDRMLISSCYTSLIACCLL